MSRATSRRGFSLLEVLVAIVVVTAAGAALTRTFTAASRAAVLFDRLRRAEIVAIEGIEVALAGNTVEPFAASEPWERSVAVAVLRPRLHRVTVDVRHRADPRVVVELQAMMYVP